MFFSFCYIEQRKLLFSNLNLGLVLSTYSPWILSSTSAMPTIKSLWSTVGRELGNSVNLFSELQGWRIVSTSETKIQSKVDQLLVKEIKDNLYWGKRLENRYWKKLDLFRFLFLLELFLKTDAFLKSQYIVRLIQKFRGSNRGS